MHKSVLHHRFKSSLHGEQDDCLDLQSNQQYEEIYNEEKIHNQKRIFHHHHHYEHIPWKGILLALILTLIGTFIIVVFICSQMGWIQFKPDDNVTFLTLAFITLVPGLYHCTIAFRAFRGCEGYSFDDIADLN